MATLKTLRKLALALPGVEEGESYGTLAFRVRKKLIARVLVDGKSVVVKASFDDRDALIEMSPKTYSVTPHYQNYTWVVVRLSAVPSGELNDLLVEAWRGIATKRAVAAYDSAR